MLSSSPLTPEQERDFIELLRKIIVCLQTDEHVDIDIKQVYNIAETNEYIE